MLPVRERFSTLAGMTGFVRTAKFAVPVAPDASVPTDTVQTEPDRMFGEQAQPPPPLKEALAGIVAVSTTPVEARSPLLA